MTAVFYVASLSLFASSMCNPDRPYIEPFVVLVALSAILLGRRLHRRLYEHNT